MRKGIYVRTVNGVRYAKAIVQGYKEFESRNKNTLAPLLLQRVDVIETRKGHKPMIVGRATICGSMHVDADSFDALRGKHLVPPGSKYDAGPKGKWLYAFIDPVELEEPEPLPENVIRHGRAWCEY